MGARGAWTVFLVVATTTGVLTYASMTALFPSAMAPELAAALSVSTSLVGLQVSLVYLGAMLSSTIGGALTRRMGPCRASQIALLLLGSGAALASLSSLPSFAVASVLMGIGYGLTNPAASHLLMRFAPPARRSLIFSLKQTGVPLGGVLAGACAPALALLLGWQPAMLTLGLLGAVAAVCLQLRRHEWDHDREPNASWLRSPLADIRLVWSLRQLRFLSLAGLCFAAVQLCVSAFTVTLLVEDLGARLVQAGLVMSAVQAAGVTGRVAWGWVADTLGNSVTAITLATTMTMAASLVTSFMTPAWPVIFSASILTLLGFAALGWNGVYLARVATLAPAGRVASASGGSLSFTFSGVLLGPTAFAALHSLLSSYALGFGVLAGVSGIGLMLVFIGNRSTSESRQSKRQ